MMEIAFWEWLHNIFLSVEAGWRNCGRKKICRQRVTLKKFRMRSRCDRQNIFFAYAPVLCTERNIKINFYAGGTHNTY
jgi:hypothetical protein